MFFYYSFDTDIFEDLSQMLAYRSPTRHALLEEMFGDTSLMKR